jgi:endoglucanase
VPITALGGVVANNLTRGNVAQIGITTAMVDRVFYDNIYFHKNTTMSSDSFTTSKVKLYPNPTSNSITIKGEKNMNQSFSIFDQMGREVLKGKLNGNATEVNLSNFSNGIFILKIEGNKESAKIIKL